MDPQLPQLPASYKYKYIQELPLVEGCECVDDVSPGIGDEYVNVNVEYIKLRLTLNNDYAINVGKSLIAVSNRFILPLRFLKCFKKEEEDTRSPPNMIGGYNRKYKTRVINTSYKKKYNKQVSKKMNKNKLKY